MRKLILGLLFVLCALSAEATVTAAQAYTGLTGCTAPSSCTTTTSLSVTLNDTLIVCAYAGTSSLTPTISDSGSNTWTAVGSQVNTTSTSYNCWHGVAKATASITGNIAWSGSPASYGIILEDLGISSYSSLDYAGSVIPGGAASCVNIAGTSNTDCPPVSADQIITLGHTNEVMIAAAVQTTANVGSWCLTAANCATGGGVLTNTNQFVIASNASYSVGTFGSFAIGTFTTTSGTTGNWGASMQVQNSGDKVKMIVFSLYTTGGASASPATQIGAFIPGP
jgi:hypothetical protein